MADPKKQLEDYKSAASRYEAQLQHATTKDEALKLAINVAESLMGAMSLAGQEEKPMLKSKTKAIMDVADQIKFSVNWVPFSQRPGRRPMSKDADALASPCSPPVTCMVPSTPPVKEAGWDSSGVTLTPGSPVAPSSAVPVQRNASTSSSTVKALREGQQSELRIQVPVAEPSIVENRVAAPALAPASHIRRLKEPVSTRKRTRKEDIILLRDSVVNGFKCPPWHKNPSSDEFISEDGSKYKDTRDLSLSPYQRQFFEGWVRPDQALPPPSIPGRDTLGTGPLMHSAQPIDLVQDAATDCSVVASLCTAIARTERGHYQILSNVLWPFDQNRGKPTLSPNGKYVVRLNFNGCWRRVTIDDRLPVSNSRILHVVDRHNPALLWPALIEKAYLKVRGGYDFPGSNSCSDLWTLTGWVPEEIYLQETEMIPSEVWKRIYRAFTYGDVLVTLGTGKMSSRQERELGLEGQHSYAILDMKEADDDRLFLVKNPWLEGKGWRGPVSAVDSPFSADANLQQGAVGVSSDRPQPTTFWIGLDQVVQHFERLYLNWNPGVFGHRQDVHFEWTVDSDGKAGANIVDHPQFSFSSKGAGLVFLLLSRHFRDAAADAKDVSDAFNDGSIRPETQLYTSGDAMKGYTSIAVYNGEGDRLYIKDSYLECTPYVSTPQCLLRWENVPSGTYTVVIDQEELPASTYTFSLSAFSVSPITLEPAKQRYPCQKVQQGVWTKQTAGGDTASPRYFENPQYMLEVSQRSSLAILLTSTNHSNPLNVKLALGYGKRIYRLQSRDVLADSGDYQASCAFASVHDLQPGLYTVIVSLFEAGKTGDYTLRIDSTSALRLESIARDGAGLLSLRVAPAIFGPHVHKLAAPIIPRRLATLTIIASFLKANYPRSHDNIGNLGRSPLRLSVELGRGPERKFLITSEQGEYSDLPIVRTETLDLDPAMLHMGLGDLWVVLDRLSTPAGLQVEELYEVQMLTDVPEAFSLGVWREWDG